MNLIWPFPTKDVQGQGRRVDEGWDLQTNPNTPVLAAADGTVQIEHDPSGFGPNYPVLMLDQPIDGFSAIYYGHVAPDQPAGAHVHAGQQIAHTQNGGSGAGDAANDPGWLEIGWWGSSGPTGPSGSMKAALLGAAIGQGGGTSTSGGGGFLGLGTPGQLKAVRAVFIIAGGSASTLLGLVLLLTWGLKDTKIGRQAAGAAVTVGLAAVAPEADAAKLVASSGARKGAKRAAAGIAQVRSDRRRARGEEQESTRRRRPRREGAIPARSEEIPDTGRGSRTVLDPEGIPF